LRNGKSRPRIFHNANCPLFRDPLGALAAPPAGGDWQLVFADDFNGTTADLDKNWEFQNGPRGHILRSRWRENAVAANGAPRLINRKEQRSGQE